MTLEEVFQDPSLKAKEKMKQVGEGLLSGSISIEEVVAFAENQTAQNQATCIEALAFSSEKSVDHADERWLHYVTKALTREEPRIKWESAKVIGNIAKKFPNSLVPSIEHLLENANNKGTVVRWATAYALGEILKLRTEHNKKLLPIMETLSKKEEEKGVKKKYLDALKKVKK